MLNYNIIKPALDLFGLTELATIDDIKNSYRRLFFKYHPDRNDNSNAAIIYSIIESYKVLKTYQKSTKINNKHYYYLDVSLEDICQSKVKYINGIDFKCNYKYLTLKEIVLNNSVILINVVPHKTFLYNDIDLLCNLNITVLESIVGTKKEIELLDGTLETIDIPENSKPNDLVVLTNQGLTREQEVGHIFIKINIIYYTDENKIKLLKSIL